jgi:hypothetical protein
MEQREGRFGGPLSWSYTAYTWGPGALLAYVVASPPLLDTECRTVEQMKLVNALCRFVEVT